MEMKILAEGPRGMAYRSTASATFAEAAGTKHDYDQVVIALGPAQLSLSIDGKPPRRRGRAATCSSLAAASRTKPRTPAASRRT
jgi:hypothetical protein